MTNAIFDSTAPEAAATSSRHVVSPEQVLEHYRLCCLSRACSVRARKEVLTGQAKFGITGDGKELPQVALATQFQPGDWRSGYYRDQTLMFALGLATIESYFAQLYADPEADTFSGGRQMVCHFSTPTVDEQGQLLPLTERYNISADISSTAGQMARGLGLAFASKKFRELPDVATPNLSHHGDEICWITIGDASTSEGIFWESLNAAGVLQVPMVVSVWDDGYGISVPIEFQTTKASISKAVAGLQREAAGSSGIEIIRAHAWDYPGLLEAYRRAARLARTEHVPVLVHVNQVTQQLGHSTSGSHERYKSAERLEFEREFDCNLKFADWIVQQGYASAERLYAIQTEAEQAVRDGQSRAYEHSQRRHLSAINALKGLLPQNSPAAAELQSAYSPTVATSVAIARKLLLKDQSLSPALEQQLQSFVQEHTLRAARDFSSHLTLEGPGSVVEVAAVPAVYAEAAESVAGFRILNDFFTAAFEQHPQLLAFGEDVGKIGDVNQGFAGLQDLYGQERVFDCGIREWSIVGQAIGLALRGFRPIAEIQYLDYLIYALSPLSDDLATLLYRSDGQQRAPVIIRTRGHRLEGIWHSGSPLGMIVNSVRGMHVCVPRNMLQAAGMYSALIKAQEPALVIECLNAYRLRERMPSNLAEFTVPLGQVELMRTGDALTIVTYGACVIICEEAADLLLERGIAVDLIDIQTLLPFDREQRIRESLVKTSKLLIVDEDVPGGASAFILSQLLDEQKVFKLLDAAPQLLSAKAHRPPYGSEGDYFSKPNAEDVAEAALALHQQ